MIYSGRFHERNQTLNT